MHILNCCRSVVLVLLLPILVHTQTRPRYTFNHSLSLRHEPSLPAHRELAAAPETLRVLAAMIAFQEDNDERTTGTGSFDLSDSLPKIIDPGPHNKQYFEQHLLFVENYFRKASGGKLIVQGVVLDNVYTLSHQMQYYSPARSSTTNIELGQLMQDAWHTVDSVSPGIPFANYGAFIIFHAGAGRDIDFISSQGFDPYPFDLPSIYLNSSSLKKMFGDSYAGVPVSGGSFVITNSMILPETENHILNGTFGKFLLQLGINGLCVASVGSHIGLPDLFDTKTGQTGIGRFGLMDGQSIFSWSGIFPPEPSAWERYFMGWAATVTLSSGDAVYSLPATGMTGVSDSIYKVLISDREYFLVENRNRDGNRDGATVTLYRNGVTSTRTWARDTKGFDFVDVDSLYGVVTDVDEFDWSLPGFVSSNTGEWFDGGILIWHIDENIINAGFATDAVNADPSHRGVDLEEADGSQDIGQSYGLLDPGNGSENGTPLDYWYAGNTATPRVNSNEFTPTSHPNSRSNNLGNTHITMKEFSVRGPRMTVRIQVGDAAIAPLAGFPKDTKFTFGKNSVSVGDFLGTGNTQIVMATDKLTSLSGASPEKLPTQSYNQSRIFGWNIDGSLIIPNGDSTGEIARATEKYGTFIGKIGLVSGGGSQVVTIGEQVTPKPAKFPRPRKPMGEPNAGASSPMAIDLNTDTLVPSPINAVLGWNVRDQNSDGVVDSLFRYSVASTILTSPVVTDSVIAYGGTKGMMYKIRRDGSSIDSIRLFTSDSSDIVSLSLITHPNELLAVSANGSIATNSDVACLVLPTVATSSDVQLKVAYAVIGNSILPNGGKAIVLASRDGIISVIRGLCPYPPARVTGFPVSLSGEILNAPALADIDGDGLKDIIVFSGNKIYAINGVGSILDNFPIVIPTKTSILTSPIIADIDGDGTPDIVAVTQEGLVLAYNKSGKMLSGFPLQAGINGGSTPAVFYMPSACLSCTDIGLAVASDDGFVYSWKTGTLHTGLTAAPKQPWPQFMHDAQNTGLGESTLTQTPISNFFPTTRAYNWPNPVDREHGYKTHIRYFVGTDAKVHIKIFDLAGDLVTELEGQGIGGLDNEVEWDVSNIQSGVYLAHIDAQGTGSSGTAVIKIAVVK